MKHKIIVAITGASGAIYAKVLLDKLEALQDQIDAVGIVMSKNALQNMYNYGNNSNKIHYPNLSAGYTKGTNRFALGYGKQRQGINCVGGVCREVPKSNGISLSITSSF